MASFRGLLQLAGQKFALAECTYAFDQAVRERGRAVARVRSGLLVLHLDVPTMRVSGLGKPKRALAQRVRVAGYSPVKKQGRHSKTALIPATRSVRMVCVGVELGCPNFPIVSCWRHWVSADGEAACFAA